MCMQGAAELVLRRCSSYVDEQGEVAAMGDDVRQQLADHITSMAQQVSCPCCCPLAINTGIPEHAVLSAYGTLSYLCLQGFMSASMMLVLHSSD